MPVLLEGKHICERCGKSFPWVYFETIRSNLSSGVFKVERIPNEPKAYHVESISINEHNVYVHCPHCGRSNRFVCEQSLKEKTL